jgi:mevalonate kinase
MNKGENMKKIPTKNYIIVAIISIATLLFVIVMSNYLTKQREYIEQEERISYLAEIKEEELENFMIENHDIMIYLANSDIQNEELENKIKTVLEQNDFYKDTIYLDMKDLDEDFYQKLALNYFDDNIINTKIVTESILIIKNQKVIDIINITDDNIDNLTEIIQESFYGEK